MIVDKMRHLTEEGKVAAKAQIAAAVQAKAVQDAQTKANAEKISKEKIKIIFDEMKKIASEGNNEMIFKIGELDKDGFVSYLSGFLCTKLKKQGFDVSEQQIVEEPFGSDPYRWDTYTDVYLNIKW